MIDCHEDWQDSRELVDLALDAYARDAKVEALEECYVNLNRYVNPPEAFLSELLLRIDELKKGALTGSSEVAIRAAEIKALEWAESEYADMGGRRSFRKRLLMRIAELKAEG